VKKCLYCSDPIQLTVGPDEANAQQPTQSHSVSLKSVSEPSQLSTSSDDPHYQSGSSCTAHSSAMDIGTESDSRQVYIIVLSHSYNICNLQLTVKLRYCKILSVNTLSSYHLTQFILISVHNNLHKFHYMQHLNPTQHLS
jgi:hypothetical protein